MAGTKIPGPRSLELMKLRQTHVARGPFHVTPVFAKKAHGAIIEDVDGNRFIDLASGIGVTSFGHTPASVSEAIQKQAGQFLHTSFNVVPYESYVRLCEKLNRLTPGIFPKKSFLANSGAEAVENAIKIARAYTQRDWVVCFDHAFHGRTFMAMSLTGKSKPYKEGVGVLPEEVIRTPFPYVYRWKKSQDPQVVSEECFKLFEKNVRPLQHKVAAVIIEPVLGEGGFVPAPVAFLEKLRRFCDEASIVLIADEIQTGFGRTGNLFACETLGLVPDLLLSAKGLGGGMPVSAVTGRAEIMDAPVVGMIGGTFGGNPVCAVAALAVIEMWESGTMKAIANRLAEHLSSALMGFQREFSHVGDVRGVGAMLAMELVKSRETKEPFLEATNRLQQYCYEHGVIILSAGSYGNVIRFLPPLNMDLALLDEALMVIHQGLHEIHH